MENLGYNNVPAILSDEFSKVPAGNTIMAIGATTSGKTTLSLSGIWDALGDIHA